VREWWKRHREFRPGEGRAKEALTVGMADAAEMSISWRVMRCGLSVRLITTSNTLPSQARMERKGHVRQGRA